MSEIKSIHIIWDDVIFKRDSIEFDIRRLNTILLPVKVKGIIESLNLMKNEYFNRLYGKKAFKLSFRNGNLIQEAELSPGWKRLSDVIELVQEHYELSSNKNQQTIFRNIENLGQSDLLELYENLLNRTKYLKYLSSIVKEEFKLIPILEYSNGTTEDSFLFRIRNKNGSILIVWENVNISRATYIFKTHPDNHATVLKRLEEFICTKDFEHKRSTLSSKSFAARKERLSLGFYEKYRHTKKGNFEAEIDYLINYTV